MIYQKLLEQKLWQKVSQINIFFSKPQVPENVGVVPLPHFGTADIKPALGDWKEWGRSRAWKGDGPAPISPLTEAKWEVTHVTPTTHHYIQHPKQRTDKIYIKTKIININLSLGDLAFKTHIWSSNTWVLASKGVLVPMWSEYTTGWEPGSVCPLLGP